MDCSATIEKIRKSIAVVYATEGQQAVVEKGSGFIFFQKGILVTCNHVIAKQDAMIFLQFPDQEKFIPAKVALRDEEHDLALLRFDDKTREPLEPSEIETVKEGISVMFAGYPLNLVSLTTHQGILSAILKDATGATTYLIDGTVNSGNSGCPLMTEDGKVIGVVNAKRMERTDLLIKMNAQKTGAVALHGVDLVELFQALISNVQLGIGYAIPCSHIPKPNTPGG